MTSLRTSVPSQLSESRFFFATSQGPRKEQQDAAVCLNSNVYGTALVVVSDGVGGDSGGQIAAQTVVKCAEDLWERSGGRFTDAYGELHKLCVLAHHRINQEGEERGISPKATIVALYLTKTHAYWVHSGDSRLYHFRDGTLLHRTLDHSLLQVLVKRGEIREEDMGSHPQQSLLLQALGGDEFGEPILSDCSVMPTDGFLLCSDGLWERTKVCEMATFLGRSRLGAPQALDAMVQKAVRRNGAKGDNVTVAVAMPAEALRSHGLSQWVQSPMVRWIALFLLIVAAVGAFYYYKAHAKVDPWMPPGVHHTSVSSPSASESS